MQRGRKSSAASVVVTLPGLRHKPPRDLTKEQATIWKAVAATKPASWFTEDSHPLLAAYCRHVCTARMLSAHIDAVPDAGLSDPDTLAMLDRLLKLRGNETKSIVTLATAMRLSQHSRLKAETAATQAEGAGDADKPWQQMRA